MGSLGNCPRVLQFCYKCPRASDPEGRLIANPYDCRQQWLRTLGCPLCTSEWFVCIECLNITAHIKNRKALSRHESLYHKKSKNDGHKRKRYEKKGKGRLDKSIENEVRHDFQDVAFLDCNTSTIESNNADTTNDSNEPKMTQYMLGVIRPLLSKKRPLLSTQQEQGRILLVTHWIARLLISTQKKAIFILRKRLLSMVMGVGTWLRIHFMQIQLVKLQTSLTTMLIFVCK